MDKNRQIRINRAALQEKDVMTSMTKGLDEIHISSRILNKLRRK